MKRIIILNLLLIFALSLEAQEVYGVYVKQKTTETIRYKPKYSGNSYRITYQVNKDGLGKEYLTVLMIHGLPEKLFPVIGTYIIKGQSSDTIELKQIYYSKPIKHKIFNDFTFFSPLTDLDARFRDTDNSLNTISSINSSKFYISELFEMDKSVNNFDPLMSVGYNLNKKPIDFLQAFYFKKFETTNAEYREFTDWVRDSLGMELLIKAGFNEFKIEKPGGKYLLNWKLRNKIWNTEIEDKEDAVKEMYLPITERFYRRKTCDTKKIKYNGLEIYPDTLVWLSDPTYGFEPFAKSYFWHSAFNEYPVVGISWDQAKAFCEWKTMMLQNEIDKARLNYRIEVDLPYDYERDYVLTSYDADNKYFIADKSNILSLICSDDRKTWELGETIMWNKSWIFSKNGYELTHPADISKIKTSEKSKPEIQLLLADLDKNGISGLKSNVSEWMNENYQQNWLPLMKIRDEIYQSIDYNDFKNKFAELKNDTISEKDYSSLKADIENLEYIFTSVYPLHKMLEKTFDKLADKDGKLVRGSNWLDETYERNAIENAKTFISPSKAYSTVGFRYVIHIYPK